MRKSAAKGAGLVVRDARGRYDHNDLELVCRCGHQLGVHTAAAPRECLNHDRHTPGADGQPCGCERFRHVTPA